MSTKKITITSLLIVVIILSSVAIFFLIQMLTIKSNIEEFKSDGNAITFTVSEETSYYLLADLEHRYDIFATNVCWVSETCLEGDGNVLIITDYQNYESLYDIEYMRLTITNTKSNEVLYFLNARESTAKIGAYSTIGAIELQAGTYKIETFDETVDFDINFRLEDEDIVFSRSIFLISSSLLIITGIGTGLGLLYYKYKKNKTEL